MKFLNLSKMMGDLINFWPNLRVAVLTEAVLIKHVYGWRVTRVHMDMESL